MKRIVFCGALALLVGLFILAGLVRAPLDVAPTVRPATKPVPMAAPQLPPITTTPPPIPAGAVN